jgi:hypothetical protein
LGGQSVAHDSAFQLPADIAAKGARGVLTHWKTKVERGVGIKRAEALAEAAAASIGLTEGTTAARIELSTLLSQYDLFSEQLAGIIEQVMMILDGWLHSASLLYARGMWSAVCCSL